MTGQGHKKQNSKEQLLSLLRLFCFWDGVLPYSPGWSSTYHVFQTILQFQGYRLVVTRLETYRVYVATDTGHALYNKINLCNWVAAYGEWWTGQDPNSPFRRQEGKCSLEKRTLNFLRTEIHQLKESSCKLNNINKAFSFFQIAATDIILVANLWGVSQD